MKKIKHFILSSLIFLISTALFGQSYKIEEVNYDITGMTRQDALVRNILINKNKEYETLEDLELYIAKLKQDFINTRCFETSEITYTLAETEDEIIPVKLQITVKDSFHFLAVPYFKYSSSDGLSLKIKAKDTNFFGSMSEFNTSLNFQFKPDTEGNPFRIFEPELALSLDYPFTAGAVTITWLNSASLSYTWGETSPEWNLATGVKVDYPMERTTLSASFTQGFIRDFDYRSTSDETFFREKFEFSTPFTICEVPDLNKLVFTPAFSIVYNWDPFINNGTSGLLCTELQGPELIGTTAFSLGRINWNGNFRDGFETILKPCLSYNTASHINSAVAPWLAGLSAEARYYKAFKYAGINIQGKGFYYYEGENFYGTEIVDSYIRGVIDTRYSLYNGLKYQSTTSAALILNIDTPVHLFTTSWEDFILTRKIGFMSKLNFELQVSPFIDIALIKTSSEIHGTSAYFDPKEGFYGAGLEVLVYPLKWSSYVVRASVGVDIGRAFLGLQNDWRNTNCRKLEISIGIGTHF